MTVATALLLVWACSGSFVDEGGLEDTEAPTVPAGVSAAAASSTAIDVSWSASTDDVELEGYRVHRDGGVVAEVTATAYGDTGLDPSTPYTYTVVAFDTAGNESAPSAPASATTDPTTSPGDTQPPTVPSGVSATATSSSAISLTWSASTDDVGVTGYRVRRNGSVVATVGGTSYGDMGLSPSTTYSYTVAALDAAGNASAPSTAAQATTQALPPPSGDALSFDPANPRWLFYEDGTPFWLTGAGDPEGFLYRGTRQPDGTRSGGGQEGIIQALADAGLTALYVQIIRRAGWGGDGDNSHSPFVTSGAENSGLDEDILDQWDGWFTLMDEAGIAPLVFFYDDGGAAPPSWSQSSSTLTAGEAAFIGAIVDRFKHHTHVIWVSAEEYTEGGRTAGHAQAIANEVRSHDPVHPMSHHQLPGLVFDFPNAAAAEVFQVQRNVGGAYNVSALHGDAVTAWENADGRYVVNFSEMTSGATKHGSLSLELQRHINWAVAMGGAYVQVIDWWVGSDPPSQTALAQAGHLARFFGATRFDLLEPADFRAAGDTEWVLAHRTELGNDYLIGYGRVVVGGIGFNGLAAGDYDLTWLDTESGQTFTEQRAVAAAGAFTFPRPSSLSGSELALYARKAGL